MDCTADELKQFIKFIYTGELEGLISNELMELAVTYKVDTLKIIHQTAVKDVSTDIIASLALHLDPGTRNSHELCNVENTYVNIVLTITT